MQKQYKNNENNNKRILMLSDGSSVHTKKWVNALLEKGFKIHLFSLTAFDENDYIKETHQRFSHTYISLNNKKNSKGDFQKINYLRALPAIKKTIKTFKPHILHAHFASSYGLLGALTGFHPFILSVWGYDVFTFPEKSFLHRMLLKYNLCRADQILSTSHVMKKKTSEYTSKDIVVTPFGVDLSIFKEKTNLSRKEFTPFSDDDFIIGTVKLLEIKYGINFLIHAFHILLQRHPDMSLKLLIVGGGNAKEELIELCEDLQIEKQVYFTGMIDHKRIPDYINLIDVYVALSIYDSESFGVAIIEAGACSKPVVVANVGGLPEVVEDGISGFIVPPRDALSAAEAIERLILNPSLRYDIGREGRARVERLYDWEKNVDQMIEIYKTYQ
jgi:L-malate glycosyltransferase